MGPFRAPQGPGPRTRVLARVREWFLARVRDRVLAWVRDLARVRGHVCRDRVLARVRDPGPCPGQGPGSGTQDLARVRLPTKEQKKYIFFTTHQRAVKERS